MDEKFDCIIVGAGPAGISAAITSAGAKLNVIVVERGEYPGSKNVQGAILYTKMLNDVLPDFWKEPSLPFERPITHQKIWIVTDDDVVEIGFKSDKWRKPPHNCYSIIRVKFDQWFAKKAEEKGATIICGTTVSDVIKKNGSVVGIKTTEDEELYADIIIACDGVNSFIAQKAGLIDEWKPWEVALAVKEVLALPKEKIEDRFNLEKDDGATIEMFGEVTKGKLGYGFLYTNKESISIGVGCRLDEFQKYNIPPYELLENMKNHPIIRKLIEGAKALEYSAHLIPEGGFYSMPPLYTDGLLIAGDAAQMVNPSHREGSNLAMTAGKLAGETAILAHTKKDFSAKCLSLFEEKIKKSYIWKDLYDHKDLEKKIADFPGILTTLPQLLSDVIFEYFTVDGRSKKEIQKRIIKMIRKKFSLIELIKTAVKFKGILRNI